MTKKILENLSKLNNLIILIIFFSIISTEAFAYLEPGVTGILIQIWVAIIAFLMAFRNYILEKVKKIISLLKKIKFKV